MSTKVNSDELKPGEIVCPKCEGTGNLDAGVFIAKLCSKCGGSGIVDWVSNAVTRPEDDVLYAHDASAVVPSSLAVKSYIADTLTLTDKMKESLAKEIAKQIDEEILNEAIRLQMQAEEQNLKQWIMNAIKGGTN